MRSEPAFVADGYSGESGISGRMLEEFDCRTGVIFPGASAGDRAVGNGLAGHPVLFELAGEDLLEGPLKIAIPGCIAGLCG